MTTIEMPETVTAYKCEEGCDLAEEDGGPLYECNTCSTRFNRDSSADGSSHRCPDCNKFAAKTGELSCADCGQGAVEEIEAVECPACSTLVDVEEWEQHLRDEHDDENEAEEAETTDAPVLSTKAMFAERIKAIRLEDRRRWEGIHAPAFRMRDGEYVHLKEESHHNGELLPCCALDEKLRGVPGSGGVRYRPEGSDRYFHARTGEHVASLYGVSVEDYRKAVKKGIGAFTPDEVPHDDPNCLGCQYAKAWKELNA